MYKVYLAWDNGIQAIRQYEKPAEAYRYMLAVKKLIERLKLARINDLKYKTGNKYVNEVFENADDILDGKVLTLFKEEVYYQHPYVIVSV